MDKYLVFIRFKFNIDTSDNYYFNLVVLERDDVYKFINELVIYSKKSKSYINVYRLKNNFLDKIAWIKEGTLYSL